MPRVMDHEVERAMQTHTLDRDRLWEGPGFDPAEFLDGRWSHGGAYLSHSNFTHDLGASVQGSQALDLGMVAKVVKRLNDEGPRAPSNGVWSVVGNTLTHNQGQTGLVLAVNGDMGGPTVRARVLGALCQILNGRSILSVKVDLRRTQAQETFEERR